jgi:hypothetical protein
MVLVRTEVSEKYFIPIFRLKDTGPFWLAARVYIMTDGNRTSWNAISTMKMIAIYCAEISVLTKTTHHHHHIAEGGFLHCYRRENLKSYIALTGCAL